MFRIRSVSQFARATGNRANIYNSQVRGKQTLSEKYAEIKNTEPNFRECAGQFFDKAA
eukprot:Pgem_evm1s15558